jgi:photosystem II stability/assembly factor-like uncharacterized protein
VLNFKHVAAFAVAALAAAPFGARAAQAVQPPISQMQWRILGPALPEGRATQIAGADDDALLYYAGTAGGGAWKSTDGGVSWENITDSIHMASVGAIAVDSHNDKIVWIGGGETNPRNDVIPEGGLYRSKNGGRSWKAIGLPGAQDISRIVLDPKDPEHVVVGVLGDPFGPSTNRGVYVSFDGGATFTRSLYLSPQSGVSDLAMDPSDPNVLYAGMWHVLRRPWTLSSGSANDDGLFKSTDGGKTWTKLSGKGLPSGAIGRIGLAVAPSQPGRVYALIESAQGVVWRSDDAGATWTMTSKDSVADQRPFYFSHLRVAPDNADNVYAVSMFLSESYNAGKTFAIPFGSYYVHPDLHDLWVSADGRRLALAGDGGIAISTDEGTHWANSGNIPATQVYRVGISSGTPYLVCGGFQDNNGYCGPAFNGNAFGIGNGDWFNAVGGDGEWVVPDPSNPRLVWGDSENGEVVIYDRVSHDVENVRPYRGTAQEDFVLANSRYRFDWESPIAFAAYDPHIAFIGANVLFETRDRGHHWRAISPDLTRNDKSKQQVSKDTVTHDESGAENYGTLLDIETSPLHKGEIWTGSDDGLVHVTLDGGAHWQNVTPPNLPADAAVETIAPSTLVDGTAYLSADRHAVGDRTAYLFATHDFGKHWSYVTGGIPRGEYVRAVRPDIHNRRIVYAGTNRGIYLSCDGGTSWQPFNNNLPAVEVRDIRFQPQFDDMIIATHGRAIWIMDDMRPVQTAGCGTPQTPVVVGPRPVIALNQYTDAMSPYQNFYASQPGGGGLFGGGGAVAKITYWLPQELKVRPTMDVYDARGHRVRHIEGTHDNFNGVDSTPTYWLSKTAGQNEFDYDLTVDGPVRYTSAPFFFRGPEEGPVLPPGRYTVALQVQGKTYRFPLVKTADPKTTTTQSEFETAFAQQRKYYDLISRIDVMLNELHRVRGALAADKSGGTKAAIADADAMTAALTSNPKNFEDSIQKPGKLREDALGLLGAQPLAQATLQLYGRLERAYTDRAVAYNAWVRSLAKLNLNVKLPRVAATGPSALADIVSR